MKEIERRELEKKAIEIFGTLERGNKEGKKYNLEEIEYIVSSLTLLILREKALNLEEFGRIDQCPFCKLEKLTEWYLETDDGIVVCKDLNSKGYKYRLLVVGSDEKFHRPIEQYSTQEIVKFLDLGRQVAEEHIKQGEAKKIADIDMQHFTIKEHFHLQFCMQ